MPWHTGNEPPIGDFLCRRLRIPNEEALVIAVNGALSDLGKRWNWEQVGTLEPKEAEQFMLDMLLEYFEEDMCGIGRIEMYARDTLPANILPCDGSQYSKADYPRLYEVLPASLIVDFDTFMTPDLRDKFVLATGLEFNFADTGGEKEHVLSLAELPEHTHTTQAHNHNTQPHSHTTQPHNHVSDYPSLGIDLEGAGVPDVTGLGNPPLQIGSTSLAGVTVDSAGVTVDNATVIVDNAGEGEAHNNMPPYYAVIFGIVAR